MTHTIDTILALADSYANAKCDIPHAIDYGTPEALDIAIVEHDKARTALRAALVEAFAQPEPWLLKSTQDLANSICRRCYPEVSQFEVLDTLAGVISQIDNMTTGMERKAAQPVRVPLSEPDIWDAYMDSDLDVDVDAQELFSFARAIERAHQIGGDV